MNKKIITRRLTFCYGHRVYGHENKCKNIHGHNGVVEIVATAPKLDSLGRIIDFSVLKEKFDGWIDKNWDHAFLWFSGDPVGQMMYSANSNTWALTALDEIQSMKNFRCEFNPTAENMAEYLLIIAPKLMAGTEVTIEKIVLYETENCWAEVSL